MPMQPGAEKMKVSVTSPANGATVTGNEVVLKVSATGYDLACDLAGKPVKEGKGHYHVEIDKSLVNMYCTPEASISLQNVKPGKHTLTVLPAQNDHAEVHENESSIEINYQPTGAKPEIKDATSAGKPSIRITSPKAGDTVSGKFDVVVEIKNYNLSCDLYGKPAVAGYGHWHLNLDSTSGPMMGMGTMAGMSCETVFHASTEGLASGSTHSLITLLLDNGHAPIEPGNFVEGRGEGQVKAVAWRIAAGASFAGLLTAACGGGGGAAPVSPTLETRTVIASPAGAAAKCPASAGLPDGAKDHGSVKAPGSSVSLEAGDSFFAPTCATQVPGGKVTVVTKNTGSALHNFSIPDQDIDLDVQAGKSITVDSLVFFCKYHRTSGMVGALLQGPG